MSGCESPNPNFQYISVPVQFTYKLFQSQLGSQRFYYVAHGYSNLHMPTPSSEEILGEGEEKVENMLLQ